MWPLGWTVPLDVGDLVRQSSWEAVEWQDRCIHHLYVGRICVIMVILKGFGQLGIAYNSSECSFNADFG